ncbi:hypothetical protein HLB44_35190 [Aquincola sp. S2]|uniref:Uncharacterized protein n=1 Tax=Pseudaquabacterium terrae TaxID=2732868 RepID=A0ABX2EUB7_9BURK|nr:hypothetical protein [Aquabacterium terrae]NRF72243.1 hypothetical protein [Aquabacterium terrae]
MQQITCDACGQPTQAYDVVNYGSIETGYRKLCGGCFNADVAERAGLDDFKHVRFEPIEMSDASGRAHEFHFRARLFGSGVALDAFELRDGHPAGYQFQGIGEPEGDLLVLLGRLIEKMRRSLAVQHLEDSDLGLQVSDRQVVRGKIECDLDDEDRMPLVVIDGREVSWAELGRMVMTFEGSQFKLEFRDMSDEL